jgi:hypothetical protein
MIIAGLELYALALAFVQSLGHVRTDEAKYLLNIPYPHPPLGRFILNLTEAWSVQEIFWRVILATLVSQAAWVVWWMGCSLARRERLALCALWTVSAAVSIQAGSIMMAPLTALQGLLLVALATRCDLNPRRSAPWAAVLWLFSLFTAYQAALFAPIVLFLFRRARFGWLATLIITGVPLFLLALYTLGNPLALASFVNAGTDNVGQGMDRILSGFLATWAIAGSVALTVAGVYGMAQSRAWIFLVTFILLSVYNFASVHLYYALLFTPLLIAGCVPLFRLRPRLASPLVILTAIGTAVLWVPFHPVFSPDPTREIVESLRLEPGKGDLVLNGPFGHDFQYESVVPVRKLTQNGILDAQAVVCIADCPEDLLREGIWSSTRSGNWEVYKRL